MRSSADENSNIPATANIASGNTSVCVKPARTLARSSAEPGTSAACATKSPSSSNERSAMSSRPPIETARMVPWMKSAGPSIATAPSRTIRRRWAMPAFMTTNTKAATRPTRASVVWANARCRRGRKASKTTPTVAAPKTISIGAIARYSMLGEWIASGSGRCGGDGHPRDRVGITCLMQGRADRRADHVENRPRVEPEHDNDRNHRSDNPLLPKRQIMAALDVRRDWACHRALVEDQHVQRSQHDAHRAKGGGDLVAGEGADQDEEFADERAQAGQREAREAGDQEGARKDRRDLLHATEVVDTARLAARNHEAHDQ